MVGMSNILTFPWMVSKHGCVSFVTAYFITLVIVGYPMLLLQMGIGQFTSQGAAGCWEFAPLFKGVGYAVIYSNSIFLIRWLEQSIALSSLLYKYSTDQDTIFPDVFQSLRALENFISNKSQAANISQASSPVQSSDTILRENTDIVIFHILWMAIFLHAIRNIPTSGKISSVIFATLCTLLFYLTIQSLFYEGAFIGLQYAFRDTSLNLLNSELWFDAFSLAFSSLSLGSFNHMTTASFNHFNNLIPRETLLCILVDTAISLVSVFFVFCSLGQVTVITGFKIEIIEYLGTYLKGKFQ